MNKLKPTILSLTLLLASTQLQGCAILGLSGAALAGKSLVEERSVGNVVDDATINTQINSYYAAHNFDGLFVDVDPDVYEGRVLLTGSVDEPITRKNAEQIAWQVNGVKEVINELQVTNKDDVESYISDSLITGEVRSRILFDSQVSLDNNFNYGIDTVNGVVYLMGVADTEAELKRVTDIARQVSGVKKVVSHILLTTDTRRNQRMASKY